MKRNIDAIYENASPTVKASIKRALEGGYSARQAMRELADAGIGTGIITPDPKKPAIRIPKKREMSMAEKEYRTILEREFRVYVDYEKWKIVLESGAIYTPDFTVWYCGKLLLVCEVKGRVAKNHSSARSILAFKTAASEWPGIRFRYAAKTKEGRWNVTEINAPPQ